jgi:hypothetical protein
MIEPLQVLARNCPKLQEFVVYDDDMRLGGGGTPFFPGGTKFEG